MSYQCNTSTTTAHTCPCQQGKHFVPMAIHWGEGIGPGLEVANGDNLLLLGRNTMEPPNGDTNQYPERPQLFHRPESGELPRDFKILASIWIVSRELKRVLELVNTEAFEFSKQGHPMLINKITLILDYSSRVASKGNPIPALAEECAA